MTAIPSSTELPVSDQSQFLPSLDSGLAGVATSGSALSKEELEKMGKLRFQKDWVLYFSGKTTYTTKQYSMSQQRIAKLDTITQFWKFFTDAPQFWRPNAMNWNQMSILVFDINMPQPKWELIRNGAIVTVTFAPTRLEFLRGTSSVPTSATAAASATKSNEGESGAPEPPAKTPEEIEADSAAEELSSLYNEIMDRAYQMILLLLVGGQANAWLQSRSQAPDASTHDFNEDLVGMYLKIRRGGCKIEMWLKKQELADPIVQLFEEALDLDMLKKETSETGLKVEITKLATSELIRSAEAKDKQFARSKGNSRAGSRGRTMGQPSRSRDLGGTPSHGSNVSLGPNGDQGHHWISGSNSAVRRRTSGSGSLSRNNSRVTSYSYQSGNRFSPAGGSGKPQWYEKPSSQSTFTRPWPPAQATIASTEGQTTSLASRSSASAGLSTTPKPVSSPSLARTQDPQ